MTKEQAIAIIQEYLYRHRYGYISKNKEFDSLYKAMQVVIQALQADGDYISRNNAITSVCQWGTTLERTGTYTITVAEMKQTITDMLCEMPTVAIPSADKTEQWQELKETITEMRDNDGTGTQQDVCKFLVNYMDVLEKQMQEPCEDAVSRQVVKEQMIKYGFHAPDMTVTEFVEDLPSVKPQEPKWIPVSERLPDDEEDVLFCVFGHIMLGYHPRDWKSTHFAERGSWELQKNVEAWMPLPSPWKGANE